MTRRPRPRFWMEGMLALLSSALLVLTLVRRDWIEAFFGVDPDAGSGAAEWGIAIVLAAVAAASAAAARADWRRARAATG